MLVQILFPPSLGIIAASVMTLIGVGILGVLEIKGIHLKYSKFFKLPAPSPTNTLKVPSRVGMFFLYAPAFLAGLASFWLFSNGDLRFLFLKSAVTIHFFKRILEVLFLHKYSGEMAVDSMIIILLSYFTLSASMIYTQFLTEGLQEPLIDLKYLGIMVFLVGISGNFYHHYLLSELRAKDGKDYKMPKGGLFEFVICPHYLFEILGFLGISLISQTFFSLCVTLGSAFYLMGRSHVTRKWYLSKFEDFPKEVKALIPYVF
ncbi:hypothetical protein PTKIN_Ptkin01aG0245100 [Pterospermum kingtungense]